MKNKQIKHKLKLYANTWRRDEQILDGAYAEMDKIAAADGYARKPAARRWPAVFASVVAAVILAVVILPYLLRGSTPEPVTYCLTNLSRTNATLDEVQQIGGAVLLTFDGDSTAQYFVFRNPGGTDREICVVVAVYKTLRDGFVDEITVTSDVTGGLVGFSQFDTFYKELPPRIVDNYKDGEYYSYLAWNTETGNYYIAVMSPTEGALYAYESKIS